MKPHRFARFSLSAAAAALLLVGCATADMADTFDEDSEVVACPKCETVWVRHSHLHPKRGFVYHTRAEMVCPDCDKMAKAYLEDGKLVLHNCPTCKVTPKVAKPKKPMSHRGHKHN